MLLARRPSGVIVWRHHNLVNSILSSVTLRLSNAVMRVDADRWLLMNAADDARAQVSQNADGVYLGGA